MVTARSFAKINLHLRILQKRADGFHDLETVFQSISLADTLSFERSATVAVTCSDARIPTDSRNLVYRAAEALHRNFDAAPFRIHIDKKIPPGGGVGGGSSNAATTLMAVNRLSRNEIPDTVLQPIASSLGSDVPFFLQSGTCYATGRGEILQKLPDSGSVPLLLVIPEHGVQTKLAYDALSALRSRGARIEPPLGEDVCRSIVQEGVGAWTAFTNDLEDPVFSRFPYFTRLLARLRETVPAWARMTGSGSTLVAAYRTAEARDAAANAMEGVRTVRAETISAMTALQDIEAIQRMVSNT